MTYYILCFIHLETRQVHIAGVTPHPNETWMKQMARNLTMEEWGILQPGHLSLSRLNHWLPGCETHPEVMQGTAEFHHQVTDTLLPQADAVFDDATAFDTAVHMLDPQPTLMQSLVGPLLLPRQFLAARFLGRHEDLHLRKRER